MSRTTYRWGPNIKKKRKKFDPRKPDTDYVLGMAPQPGDPSEDGTVHGRIDGQARLVGETFAEITGLARSVERREKKPTRAEWEKEIEQRLTMVEGRLSVTTAAREATKDARVESRRALRALLEDIATNVAAAIDMVAEK
jgi:hypothetical protein